MVNFDDIFGEDETLSNEDLLRYVNERTSAEEKNVIEEKIFEQAFEKDALEGLQKVKNVTSITKQVEYLNEKLKQQLQSKKQQKEKRKIMDMQWIILAVILLLFICIVSYMVVRLQHKVQQHTEQKS